MCAIWIYLYGYSYMDIDGGVTRSLVVEFMAHTFQFGVSDDIWSSLIMMMSSSIMKI